MRRRLWTRAVAVGLLAALLVGCGEEEVVLPGERVDIRADLSAPLDPTETEPAAPEGPVNRAAPISLPAPQLNANWTHKAGSPAHRVPQPALNTVLTQVWSQDIGAGNSRRHRLTVDPVIQGGQVFTMDSQARVTAMTTGGQVIWTRDLTRPGDRAEDASGGGLAVQGNRLFVASAFGQLYALDAASGGTIWVQELDAVASGAPTVVGDVVTLITRDARAWGIDVNNGRVRWERPGARSNVGIVGASSPAIADGRVILPFTSGEITALTLNTGETQWFTSLAGRRIGPVFAQILDIGGDPVIAGNRIYLANTSGRTVAVDAATGQRVWTVDEGAFDPVWVEGGSVFLISDRNELLRLSAETGERIWGVELPFFEPVRRARRLKDVYVHYGPVMAGGRLLVASDDGLLRSFSPVDGSLVSVIQLPEPAARPPVVAGGTLYIVGESGTLHAFR
jgi:outer membrane protein assembly factor BamB